jgi:hypothetical protein
VPFIVPRPDALSAQITTPGNKAACATGSVLYSAGRAVLSSKFHLSLNRLRLNVSPLLPNPYIRMIPSFVARHSSLAARLSAVDRQPADAPNL